MAVLNRYSEQKTIKLVVRNYNYKIGKSYVCFFVFITRAHLNYNYIVCKWFSTLY